MRCTADVFISEEREGEREGERMYITERLKSARHERAHERLPIYAPEQRDATIPILADTRASPI